MAGASRGRAAIKFIFWTSLSVGFFVLVGYFHFRGKFAGWYYYTAKEDGYAVNANTFKDANKDQPAMLEVGSFETLDGLKAVAVKKGDRLPKLCNGIISEEVLTKGERAVLENGQLKVLMPWKMEDAKGFKFKNTFKHKGIKTYPWAALYNVLLVFGLGISLGYMAEGFTDLLGIKVEKIRHFEGH
jgi:hypothetical protein